MLYDEDSLLPLSGIQHFAFCRRQWALIHIEQQWHENLQTAEGMNLHDRVHSMVPTETRGEIIQARSLPLVSYRLGLYGVADLVEFHAIGEASDCGARIAGRSGYWAVQPVEYKRGRPKRDDRDAVQLCAQALCLEEMLMVKINSGSLYYGQTRHRIDVIFEEGLRRRVEDLANEMHQVYAVGTTPTAPDHVSCKLCSLKDLCLPAITRSNQKVSSYVQSHAYVMENGANECEN